MSQSTCQMSADLIAIDHCSGVLFHTSNIWLLLVPRRLMSIMRKCVMCRATYAQHPLRLQCGLQAGITAQILLATGVDQYRKPEKGMYDYFIEHGNGGQLPGLSCHTCVTM